MSLGERCHCAWAPSPTLLIPCPLRCALTHGPLALAEIFSGGVHLKTNLPSPQSAALPACLGHTTPRAINRSQWKVWTLTSWKPLKTESRGAALLRLLTSWGRTPRLRRLGNACGGLKDVFRVLQTMQCWMLTVPEHRWRWKEKHVLWFSNYSFDHRSVGVWFLLLFCLLSHTDTTALLMWSSPENYASTDADRPVRVLR